MFSFTGVVYFTGLKCNQSLILRRDYLNDVLLDQSLLLCCRFRLQLTIVFLHYIPLFYVDLINALISKLNYFITMTSQRARWRLKSPASRLFTKQFIQARIKENIKSLRHWSLCGQFTGDR